MAERKVTRIVCATTVEELRRHVETAAEGPLIVINWNRLEDGVDDLSFRLGAAKVLIADFDGTLHPGSQWMQMRTLMNPGGAAADQAAAERYYGLSSAERTAYDNNAFIFGSIRFLQEAGVSYGEMREAMRVLHPREGALDLLRMFNDRSMVVSFGIRDAIEQWLRYYSVHSRVSSLQMKWGAHNVLEGYEPGTVVTDDNKGFVATAAMAHFGVEPRDCLVIGDSVTDIGMMIDGTLGVLVIPGTDPQKIRRKARAEELPDLWPRVSAVLVSDSLQPLLDQESWSSHLDRS